MARRAIWPLLLACAISGSGCVPASWGAGALLYPSRRPVTMARPAGARDVEFRSDGLTLRGWKFAAKTPRRGTVVFLHGISDKRMSGVHVGERLTARGFDVLTYDGRAHGASDGRMCTYGFHEKRDLGRAIAGLDAPVLVMGTSLGAAVAMQAAADDRRIAAVIAVAVFSDLETIATDRAPFFFTARSIGAAIEAAGQAAAFNPDEVSPLRAAARITVPVMLIHGAQDRETSPDHSRRVYAALKARRSLVIVPQRGHNDSLTPEVWTRIEEWMDQTTAAAAEER